MKAWNSLHCSGMYSLLKVPIHGQNAPTHNSNITKEVYAAICTCEMQTLFFFVSTMGDADSSLTVNKSKCGVMLLLMILIVNCY